MTSSHRLLEPNAFAAPRLADRYVSWARAVVTVGEHSYQDQWDKSELALAAYTLADRLDEIEAEVRKKFPTASIPRAAPPFGESLKTGKPIDAESLGRIKAAATLRNAERTAYAAEVGESLPVLAELKALNDARKLKLQDAQSRLYGAIINREVPAFWYAGGSTNDPRAVPDGELVKDWNSVGDGNLKRRGYIWRDRAAWHVYVDAAKLAEIFPRHAPTIQTVGSISMDALSPYLRLMIAVATKQGIAPENHSTVESLKADLLADAPGYGLSVGTGNSGFDLSPTWAEEIAKAIRWPGARLGKAKGGNQRT